jgi:hypothetical protein
MRHYGKSGHDCATVIASVLRNFVLCSARFVHDIACAHMKAAAGFGQHHASGFAQEK